jgi:hypothetical protein
MQKENGYAEKIIETLTNAKMPLAIETIRERAEIGNWETALKHCLELMIERKILGQKTSKSWVFWIKKNGD